MTDDQRWRTCRFWDPMATPGHVDGASWGARLLADSGAEGEAVESSSLPVASAIHHTGAQLVTAPGFGCVQWAAQDGDGD